MTFDAGDWEPVFTVHDFYDGPRSGFASFGGAPHAYASEWDERVDDWNDAYLLSPITDEQLELAKEDWDIWCRWVSAHQDQRLAPEDAHPALAEDRPRHEKLRPLVEEALAVDKTRAVRAIPEFRGTISPVYALEARWRAA